MPNTIDPDALIAAVQESELGRGSTGFCLACGEASDGCEPDARNYPCDTCGKREVYGAMELIIMGYGS